MSDMGLYGEGSFVLIRFDSGGPPNPSGTLEKGMAQYGFSRTWRHRRELFLQEFARLLLRSLITDSHGLGTILGCFLLHTLDVLIDAFPNPNSKLPFALPVLKVSGVRTLMSPYSCTRGLTLT